MRRHLIQHLVSICIHVCTHARTHTSHIRVSLYRLELTVSLSLVPASHPCDSFSVTTAQGPEDRTVKETEIPASRELETKKVHARRKE